MSEELKVWIEHNLCTGDGLCTQLASEVFEFDDAGVAHVKDSEDGPLLTEPGATAKVPERLRLDVIDAADGCPGDCIHVARISDGVEIAGPDAD